MPYVKFTTGHTDCRGIQRYLEKDGRALATDYLNLDAPVIGVSDGHEDYAAFDWAAAMDETRHALENDKPWRGQHVRTSKHYIISPDPKDDISLSDLRGLAKAWAKEYRRLRGRYRLPRRQRQWHPACAPRDQQHEPRNRT